LQRLASTVPARVIWLCESQRPSQRNRNKETGDRGCSFH
jgi:hypothetical protein